VGVVSRRAFVVHLGDSGVREAEAVVAVEGDELSRGEGFDATRVPTTSANGRSLGVTV
jgi:hypothetical protein